jgi:hypothetical protein
MTCSDGSACQWPFSLALSLIAVRHEALIVSDGGGRPSWLGRRSGLVKLEAAWPGVAGEGGSSLDKVAYGAGCVARQAG